MTPPRRRRLHPLLGTPLFGVALFAAYAVATVGVALVAAVDLARTDRPIAAETLIAWSQDHILLAAFITALAAIPVTLKLGGLFSIT